MAISKRNKIIDHYVCRHYSLDWFIYHITTNSLYRLSDSKIAA